MRDIVLEKLDFGQMKRKTASPMVAAQAVKRWMGEPR